MSESFYFNGDVQFINRPKNATIHGFNRGSQDDELRAALVQLGQLVRDSERLPASEKDASAELVHEVAAEIESGQPSAERVRPVLDRLKNLVHAASDIAKPVIEVADKIMVLLQRK